MNVSRCPNCGKNFIAEETHRCYRDRIEETTVLYYSVFIPLKVDGKDVALLISEDAKQLYNIKPSPTKMKRPDSPTGDDTEPDFARTFWNYPRM